jgi:hypothetical protein
MAKLQTIPDRLETPPEMPERVRAAQMLLQAIYNQTLYIGSNAGILSS